ncbi:MAG: M20/M25/M40 family metallo-hydrolase [Bacteroidales bacterium]|nr:M20/M25/M40 family metallo-hydrolase [Bacteroidales bacterium]
MQKMTRSAADLLKEMIAIPSTSFKEEKVADFLFARLSERAGRLNDRHKTVGKSGEIVVERFANNIVLYRTDFASDKETLMLNSHIDTVEPAATYTFDPFSPFEKDGCIYGLGSNDDGGSVVSQINAFFYLNGERIGAEPVAPEELNVNLMLVLSAEEERSGQNGMSKFVEEFHIQPICALIGEPTGMEAAIAERGLLVLDGCATGVSGHAARNEGVNALYIALDDIQRLRNFEFAKKSPLMGDVKLTVTQLNCGTVHNVVPDKATFVVDIRPTEQYDNREILDMLQKEVKSELVARNLKNRSSATPQEHLLMKTVEKLQIPVQISATTSDWMKFPRPAVKMGPGLSARSHKADEFIRIEELAGGIEGYINFIKNI